MSSAGLSFRVGIMGSTLTITGMLCSVRVCIAFSRLLGAGALGSIMAASWSSLVVIVSATVHGI